MHEKVEPANNIDSYLTRADFKPLPDDRVIIDLDLDSKFNPNNVLSKKPLSHDSMREFRNYQRHFYKIIAEINKSSLQASEQLYNRAGQLVAQYLGFWPVVRVEMEGMAKAKFDTFRAFLGEISELPIKERIRAFKDWLDSKYPEPIDWKTTTLTSLLDVEDHVRPSELPNALYAAKYLRRIGIEPQDLREAFDTEIERIASTSSFTEFSKKLVEISNLDKIPKINAVRDWLSSQYPEPVDWKAETLESLITRGDRPASIPSKNIICKHLSAIDLLPVDLQNDFSTFSARISSLEKDKKIES